LPEHDAEIIAARAEGNGSRFPPILTRD
jgi:hypothetical protein